MFIRSHTFFTVSSLWSLSQALGIPQQKVKIKDPMRDVYNTLATLKQEGFEGRVTGDIANVNHKPFYESACKQKDSGACC